MVFDRIFKKDLEEELERCRGEAESLSKDNEKLRSRLAKREEKAKSEPGMIQELKEALNRAENKIQVLEHTISEQKSNSEMSASSVCAETFYLPARKSLEVLSRLSSLKSGSENLLSFYLPAGRAVSSIEGLDGEAAGFIGGAGAQNGIAGFFDLSDVSLCRIFAVLPFSPESLSESLSLSFNTGPAEEIVGKKITVAFVLAHGGESFIGVSNETDLLYGQLVKSSVKEKHTKGGWSQKRFERLREEDIRHHAEKAGEAFMGMMDEYRGIVDLIVIGGDKALGDLIVGNPPVPKIYRQFETRPEKHAGEKIKKEIWSCRFYKLS
ncbi:hypothetical protein F1737_00200 [Methanoplanus sp. FWC-SCC4]|uniref:Actinobacteria/chloroflexi VLRF1 release factor domain-containing protein n=1 Tax=Methanochimaera problematica TaxID=2609417 RepID=A0AA97I2V0_9EURY|nr:Vms1/Ankzf1 family peptidyl-tRNA hydrolase [Methanoplanus sp. FWC-SCC4]WOF15206.1 hypothetical protein F1737_00200 [Methanoplanus sp. FWC-SCC4]